MPNTQHTNLFALCISSGPQKMPLYFDSYDALLEARAGLVKAFSTEEGLVIEEDTTNRILFHQMKDAVDTVRLWLEGILPLDLAGMEPPENRVAHHGTKADQMIEMLTGGNGASAEEIAQAFGIKKASATSRISVETRKRGLTVRRENGRYII